jgi:hypothetical protein
MPYRGARGLVLIGARTRAPRDLPVELAAMRAERRPWLLDLYHATPAGRWHRFAELELIAGAAPADSPDLRFDADRNRLPGAGLDDCIRRLREPSYRAAQGPHPR